MLGKLSHEAATLGRSAVLQPGAMLGLGPRLGRRLQQSPLTDVWPRPQATLDLDFANQRFYARGRGQSVDTATAGITFTRASTATYFDAAGVLQTADVNAPRYDHDPVTLAPRGLLIEEAATNLLLRSSEFDNAVWTKNNVTVEPNVALATDGTMTADKLTGTGAAGPAWIRQGYATAPFLTTYIFSSFVDIKAGTYGYARLSATTASNASPSITINLTTGEYTTRAGSGAVFVVTPMPDGWYRVTLSRSYFAYGLNCLALYLTSYGGTADAGASSNYPAAGEYIYIAAAQFEAGAVATSYIPTTTAAVTRAADVATLTRTAFSDWYRQDEGTFVTEHRSGTDLLSTRVWRASDGTVNNLLQLMGTNASGVGPALECVVGGVFQFSLIDGNETTNTSHLTAAAYRVNDFASSRDGRTVVADTAGTLPTVDRMFLGYDGTTDYLNGHLARITYYPKRLSNPMLQQLSRVS